MPLSHLDKETKAAERDKFLAETERIKLEKKKLEIEISKSGFWTKNNIWKILSTAFIGAGVFGFYYDYVGKSILERDSIVNQLRNERQQKSLGILKHHLDSDSIALIKKETILSIEALKNDSLTKTLTITQLKLSEANRDVINFKDILSNKNSTKRQVYVAQIKLENSLKQLNKYKLSNDSLRNDAVANSQMNEVPAFFEFKYGDSTLQARTIKFIVQTAWNDPELKKPVTFRLINNGARLNVMNLFRGCKFNLIMQDKVFRLKNQKYPFETSGYGSTDFETFVVNVEKK